MGGLLVPPNRISANPVSYTHLDVYKRQPEEEDLEESPMARLKRQEIELENMERHPDDPLIGKSPGKQTKLGLE